jgi:hypothetical protein
MRSRAPHRPSSRIIRFYYLYFYRNRQPHLNIRQTKKHVLKTKSASPRWVPLVVCASIAQDGASAVNAERLKSVIGAGLNSLVQIPSGETEFAKSRVQFA